MNIEIIKCLNDNYSYLIFEEETNTVSIIDPAEFMPCDKVIQKYKKLDYILNTHHHADHVDGNIELKKKYNSKIMGFEDDKDRIPGIDILLKNNQNKKIGNLDFKTLFIPGHTKGHVAFYFKNEKIVFTGDTLLKKKSIEISSKIKNGLPTIPTTIGDELKTNIFLRYDDNDIKQVLNLKDSSHEEVFSKLRDLKDVF